MGFPGLYLGHSMSSRVALNLFLPLGMDTKGQTGRMEYKTRLNTHFKAPSRLCTSKSSSPTSLQAKELHHVNAASVLPGPRKSWGHSRFNQHIHPAPAQSVTVLTSPRVTAICHEKSSASYSFSTSITPVGRQGFQRKQAV